MMMVINLLSRALDRAKHNVGQLFGSRCGMLSLSVIFKSLQNYAIISVKVVRLRT